MRILHVINSLSPAGAERHLANLLGPLDALGVENHLVTFYPGNGYPDQVARHVRRCELAVGLPRALGVTTRMAREVDVVHTSVTNADIIGRVAASLARRPAFTTVQTAAYNFSHHALLGVSPLRHGINQLVDAATARLATRIFVVSSTVRREYIAGLRVPAERVEMVKNSVDRSEFDPDGGPAREACRAALGIAPDEFAVITLGRLIALKAHDEAVRAVAAAAAGRKLRLVIAGEGPERAKLEALVARTGAPVSLPGRRSSAETLKAADLFILPSYMEGASLSLIEAMSMGLPCLCSDIEQNTETGADAAEYHPVGDVDALARAVARLADDDARRSALAARARERARTYDAHTVAAEFVRAIERALAA